MSTTSIQALVKKIAAATEPGIVYASGITDGQTAYAAAHIAQETGGQVLFVVTSYEKAKKLEEFLSFFSPNGKIFLLPDEERSLFTYDAKSRMLEHMRIESLAAAAAGEPAIFIAPVMAAVKGMCTPDEFRKNMIDIAIGDDVSFDDIRGRLSAMGYERVDMTEVKGQYSIRGEIIDVFPPDAEYPYRIDLFDTEVDGLKTFDPMNQRSIKNMQKISIMPAVVPPAGAGGVAYLWDYMAPGAVIIADDWDRLREQRDLADRDWTESAVAAAEKGTGKASANGMDADATANSGTDHGIVIGAGSDSAVGARVGVSEKIGEIPGIARPAEIFTDMGTLAAAMQSHPSLVTTPFKKSLHDIDALAELVSINAVAGVVFNGDMENYGKELKRLITEKYEVHVACATGERRENLMEYAGRTGIEGSVSYDEGYLPESMYFTDDLLAYIADGNIFKSVKKKRKKKASKGRQIKAFTDLKKGDYVVHENHGIGRFLGIEPLVVEGIRKDYMLIKYADKDKLYVPVEQMDMVQTYIGSGGAAPKISKLSSGDWKKTKARAKAAIAGMAEELVRLSAERRMEEGYAFSPDTPWQAEFEESFPYQETENQLRCVDEIKGDMEQPWPMDRLLCGDVGFGKTEVAARAIFKCVMEGKQAAVLVPTTILANQHFHTLKERFADFACTVDMLCRFRNEAEQKKTIEAVAEGSVDVLIGTHRILSKDVKFKDLGLLVIDEEQRFGVQHKEAIKMLKKNVDVLTLSATPIPRTLHMSLSGIRSMSTLEEPPEDRYPVQTYVLEQDDQLVREILMRELDRGGQSFVVYNRVRGINAVADGLRHLLPEARIAVAHGQMNETKLEDIMTAFVEQEFDILVATTIIESGIDVPNANTLIILDADNYGLAQLYQLKGRVGRSNRAAYAYFMYKKDKVLSEVAVKRLKAIREFTEFGSGFRIAMKDLEIRGAGNLLGTEQSGHMMMIGYELYCKLIDDAVRKLRGERVMEREEEVAIEIKVDAFISSDYIEDEKLKLDMYKRIAEIKTTADMSDVTDELVDRFGDIPPETESLMKVALVQARCRSAGISRVWLSEGKVVYDFIPGNNALTPEIFVKLTDAYGMKLIINMGKKPFIKMPAARRKLLDEIVDFLEVFEEAEEEAQEA